MSDHDSDETRYQDALDKAIHWITAGVLIGGLLAGLIYPIVRFWPFR